MRYDELVLGGLSGLHREPDAMSPDDLYRYRALERPSVPSLLINKGGANVVVGVNGAPQTLHPYPVRLLAVGRPYPGFPKPTRLG